MLSHAVGYLYFISSYTISFPVHVWWWRQQWQKFTWAKTHRRRTSIAWIICGCLSGLRMLFTWPTYIRACTGYIKQIGRKRNSSGKKTHIEMGLQSGCMRACACFCVALSHDERVKTQTQRNGETKESERGNIYGANCTMFETLLLASLICSHSTCVPERSRYINLRWASRMSCLCRYMRIFLCPRIQHNITPLCKRIVYDLACSKLARTYT